MPRGREAEAFSLLAGVDDSPRILIIDDDPQVIRDLIRVLSGPRIHLNDFDFRAEGEHDLNKVDQYIDADNVDVFIVDLKLKANEHSAEDLELGEQLVRKIAASSSAGIVVYSSEPVDQTVPSLYEGADDYIAKGEYPAVIRARIAALWRRIKATRPSFSQTLVHNKRAFRLGEWHFEVGSRDLVNQVDKTIRITPLEHALLAHLVTIEDNEIDRDYFAAYVLGRVTHDVDRRLDNLVSRVRKKLGDSVQLIGRRGGGYKLLNILELTQL